MYIKKYFFSLISLYNFCFFKLLLIQRKPGVVAHGASVNRHSTFSGFVKVIRHFQRFVDAEPLNLLICRYKLTSVFPDDSTCEIVNKMD